MSDFQPRTGVAPKGASEQQTLAGSLADDVPGGIVSTDGVTITGDGRAQNPLRASGESGGGRTFPGDFSLSWIGGGHILVGSPVGVNAGLGGTPGVDYVQPLLTSRAVAGIVIAKTGTNVTVQVDGIVSLPVATWQAVIDGGAAPNRGDVVWSSQIAPGNLTTTGPTAGQTATQIGVFLNGTDLKLLNGPALLGSAY